VLVVREDVGRHNAVDKAVGWALLAGLVPLSGTVLMVSGRASFELVQKAAMAGIPLLAAVSAPSSLAVDLAEGVPAPETGVERNFYTTSSCGVCGKGALEEVAVHAERLPAGPAIARDLLAALPDRLRQPTFERTGGLHATGLFDPGGELLLVREDVGRHNAMDKVIGWALREGLVPLHPHVLCVSGRLSFELVQKAAVAGAPVLVGVSAPTSLAVRLAADRGLTLCGFARGDRVNVYTGEERVR
jgi:formate dehydrogenase accessory protein FdhD